MCCKRAALRVQQRCAARAELTSMCPVEEIINNPGREPLPAAEDVEGGLVILGVPRLGVEDRTPCRNIAAASSQGGTGNLRSVQGWRKGPWLSKTSNRRSANPGARAAMARKESAHDAQ